MKLLLIHADFIEWTPKKKAIQKPEEAVENKPARVDEALVAFSAVEKADEKDPKKIIENGVKNIVSVFNEVRAKNIVIYPYVHLSSAPSFPSTALDVLKGMEKMISDMKLPVFRAPFGWYKAFNIKCKGHPLSELSREISADGEGSQKTIATTEEKIDAHHILREISKPKLDREKLKENDHRILGQRMDLFSFSEVAPGMVFWHENGLMIYNELIRYWREEHRKAGYKEISTPFVLDKKLWQISGHWEKYRDNIFLTKYEGRDFAVKPMNCPGGILVYKAKPKSYKELPLRVAELGIVHRHELSGVLAGLFRVVKLTQDDAHIYCTEEQLEQEVIGVIDLIGKFYKKFGFSYHVELSTRPEKRIGSDKLWDRAESVLENVLKKKKMDYKLNKGDGAFYGPKIDFHIKDSLGRTWQCATIQADFAMPERFELEYNGEDNAPHRPVMLHRTVYGSLERFIGILLEHLNGNLPVWLAPAQVRVISFTDRNNPSCEKVYKSLVEAGIRAELDTENRTVEYKIRDAELQKIPYMVVIGDKEEKNGTLAVRRRGEKPEFGVRLDDFVKEVCRKNDKRE
jgi:threonyl-tRNA synthetase